MASRVSVFSDRHCFLRCRLAKIGKKGYLLLKAEQEDPTDKIF